jgi:hypothetical protein
MRRLTAVVLVLLAVLALAATGCGGDDEASSATPTEEWANDFCSAVSTWTDELQQIGESISDPTSLSVDAIRDAGEQASDATDAFVEDIRDLGSPDTESGDEIESSLETLGDTLEAEKNDVSEAIDGIEDFSDLPAAVTTIGASLSAMGTAFQTALTSLENEDVGGEIESAFESSDACDEISQSS